MHREIGNSAVYLERLGLLCGSVEKSWQI